ncbi:hypothetical protein ACO0E1_15695 [Curtobacterium sp. RRHDQ66]|uniref:hypothetical protein n=1 Tax=Curtobacterium guangdongense TaxID=3413380 RepID=UPI003BF3070E
MGNLRSVRPSVLGAALLACAALALTGCSSADTAADRTPSSTPTPATPTAAADPDPVVMDEDQSAPAVCGQLSALSTMTLNGRVGLQQGDVTEAGLEALLSAARFGYEHLSSTDTRLSNAIAYAQRYLEEHPAPESGPALDDSPEWDLAMRSLNTACQEAGSSVVSTAQYGG